MVGKGEASVLKLPWCDNLEPAAMKQSEELAFES